MTYPTWSDLNNDAIVPPLGARKPFDSSPFAVMASCRPDLAVVKSHTKNPKVSSFFNSTLITSDGCDKGICVAGPFIGAPYAAMLLESLIARGAGQIIVLGWCGAVSEALQVGDIILVDRAIVDEGTSCNYLHLDEQVPVSLPDLNLTDQLGAFLAASDIGFQKAAIWTTDAIYRETKNKVAHFRRLGARAVEMECSALFSVARYRKVSIAGLLVVSDSVASTDWDPGFKKKRFKQARQTACQAVMRFAGNMVKNE